MKKLFFLGFVLTIGSSAHSEALLKYRCSDRFLQSRLQIEDTGLVIVSESNGDGDAQEIRRQLSPDQIIKLRSIIFSLDPKALQMHPTEVGSHNQGSLVAYQHGKEVVIQDIDVELYTTIGYAKKNTSCSDLDWLKKLVLPFVKMKLKFEWPVVEWPKLCDFDLTRG